VRRDDRAQDLPEAVLGDELSRARSRVLIDAAEVTPAAAPPLRALSLFPPPPRLYPSRFSFASLKPLQAAAESEELDRADASPLLGSVARALLLLPSSTYVCASVPGTALSLCRADAQAQTFGREALAALPAEDRPKVRSWEARRRAEQQLLTASGGGASRAARLPPTASGTRPPQRPPAEPLLVRVGRPPHPHTRPYRKL
jgi:hypothetical protein